jgi:drug/metabolite transporter (DMT)-like permease
MSGGGNPAVGRIGLAEIGLLLLLSLAWGAAYVFIRVGIVDGASPLAFAASRYALSAAAFAALAAGRRVPFPSRRAVAVSAGVGGTLIIGIYGGLLYWGEQFTTGGYAAVLASTAPLMTVGFGFLLLASERLAWRGLVGMGVGFAGAIVLVLPQLYGSAIGSWQGPVFILAAMVSVAFGTVLLRRIGGGRQNLWQIGSQFAVAGLLLGVAALFVPGSERLPVTAPVLGVLAVLVLVSSVLGYFAYYALHHRVGPVRANIVAYLTPVVGVGIGSGFFAEPVTALELLGVAVVLAGVTLVLWEASRRPAPPPAAPAPAESGPSRAS